jgi:hypothetical protein
MTSSLLHWNAPPTQHWEPYWCLKGKGCVLGEGHHRHLGVVATIIAESTLLKGLKVDDFQVPFNQWKWSWDKCIACLKGIKWCTR